MPRWTIKSASAAAFPLYLLRYSPLFADFAIFAAARQRLAVTCRHSWFASIPAAMLNLFPGLPLQTLVSWIHSFHVGHHISGNGEWPHIPTSFKRSNLPTSPTAPPHYTTTAVATRGNAYAPRRWRTGARTHCCLVCYRNHTALIFETARHSPAATSPPPPPPRHTFHFLWVSRSRTTALPANSRSKTPLSTSGSYDKIICGVASPANKRGGR